MQPSFILLSQQNEVQTRLESIKDKIEPLNIVPFVAFCQFQISMSHWWRILSRNLTLTITYD
jgi:hypothetical protein